ncbi:MAG: hypothetical protein JJE42_12765 [Burkholderiales bacterium]|nr:hypothetical protein [Burkholderiales bacterium]
MASTESFGLILYLDNGLAGSPSVYTQVAGVTEIGGLFSFDRSIIDTSLIADEVKSFLAGQLDPGAVDFGLLFDSAEATHSDTTGLIYTMKTRGLFSWCLKIPASTAAGAVATYMYFQGVTTALNPAGAQDDVIRATVSIKMSGLPVFVANSPPLV